MRYYFMIQEDPRSGGPGPRGHHGHGGCGGRRDFDGPRGRDFGPRGGGFEGPRGGGDFEGPRDGFGRRGGRPGFGGRGEGDPRGRGEAGGFGGDGFGGPEFGPGFGPGPRGPRGGMGFGPRGPHHGHHGRGKGRRGDVRAAVLNLLNEQSMTGYQLMGAIEEKSQGLWKPGPGSIYPALQLLADEGLITLTGADEAGKKPYAITDEGKKYLAEHPEQTKAPWDRVTRDLQGVLSLRPELEQLAAAVRQAATVAAEGQQAKVKDVLTRARKEVYRILASDEDDAGTNTPDGDSNN